MNDSKISTSVVYLTLIKAMNIVIPFICTPYLSRIFGAERIGIYSYTNSFAAYFALVAALGTMSYGSREISRNRDDKYQRSKSFWEIEIITIVTTLICLALWLVFVLFSHQYSNYYLVLSVNVLAVLFDITWLFYGLEEYRYLAIRVVTVKVIGATSIFLFVRKSSDLMLYFVIMVLTQLISNSIVWLGLSKYITKIPVKELRFRTHIKETMIYFVPSVATSVYNVLDKSFLGFIRKDTYESGCYEEAETIISVAKGVAFSAVNAVVGVRNSYLYKNNEIQIIRDNIKKSLDFVFFMGFAVTFGLLSVANDFIYVYLGEGFDYAVPLLMILSFVVILIGISDCLGSQYYIPVGKRRVSARFIIIGAIVNVVLNLAMIPRLGAVGASIATVIAETVIAALYIIYASEYCPLSTVLGCGYKKLVAGVVMFIVLLFVNALSLPAIALLLTKFIIGVVVYVGTLIIMKDTSVTSILRRKK